MDINWTYATGTQLTDGGDLATVTGQNEVKTRVEFRLRTWAGSWYYDIQEGIPWLEILRGPTDDSILTAILRGELSRLFGSEKIESVSATRNQDRSVSFSCVIDGEKIEAEIGN